jgi:hypothetical protein
MYTHPLTHSHTHSHTHTLSHTQTFVTQIPANSRIPIKQVQCTHAHTHTHTHTHTYIYIYICIYIYIYIYITHTHKTHIVTHDHIHAEQMHAHTCLPPGMIKQACPPAGSNHTHTHTHTHTFIPILNTRIRATCRPRPESLRQPAALWRAVRQRRLPHW